MVSLMYPCVLIVLVMLLMVFLVTYVVPTFATLYTSMHAKLPAMTVWLIAIGTTARSYILVFAGALVGGIFLFRWWARRESARVTIDRIKLKMPLAGRHLAEIPGGAALAHSEHAADGRHSAGAGHGNGGRFAGHAAAAAGRRGGRQERARRAAAVGIAEGLEACFRGLAIDMIEVGESTGALPAMLNSVAEFFEEDVNTRMTATLSLIEPAIMIVMGSFVAFVLIALYLPIFSLADTIG